MGILSFLALPLGFVMDWIYMVVQNYGWAIVIFTILTKVLTFPLSIQQQKSTARMAAFQPEIKAIQDKYKNDTAKQNEEMARFQQENGFNPLSGCMPMAVNMFVLFGLIEVIYRPIQYMMHVSKDVISKAVVLADMATFNEAGKIVYNAGVKVTAVENELIVAVQNAPEKFAELFGNNLAEIQNFNFSFLGINLSETATIGFNLPIILPVLAVLTMILSTIISTKISGQEMQGSMKYMPWIMSIMFGSFCFTVPVGFSLYYTISNLLMILQSYVVSKFYPAEKIKAQVQAEISEKAKSRKARKEIVVKNEEGKEVTKNVSQSQLESIRLAKARELDKERYGE